jgi:hypothetical protein
MEGILNLTQIKSEFRSNLVQKSPGKCLSELKITQKSPKQFKIHSDIRPPPQILIITTQNAT